MNINIDIIKIPKRYPHSNNKLKLFQKGDEQYTSQQSKKYEPYMVT